MAKELDIRELMALVDLVKDDGKYTEKMKAMQDAEKRLAAQTQKFQTMEELEAQKDALRAEKDQLAVDKAAFEEYMAAKEAKAKDHLKQRETELEQRYQALKKEFEGTRQMRAEAEDAKLANATLLQNLDLRSQVLSKQEAAVRTQENKVRQAVAAMSKYWEEVTHG